MFGNVKQQQGVESNEVDSLGGRVLRKTGLYNDTIKLAYGTESKKGALGVVLKLEDENGSTHDETIWVTNREKSNTYVDKDGNQQYLPGYNMVNAICLMVCGKELSEVELVEKTVPVFNYEARSEVPTKVQVLDDLMGGKIITGMMKYIENKTYQVNGEGPYLPYAETREGSEISKVFHAETRQTIVEARAQAEATFIDSWSEKNHAEVVRNKCVAPEKLHPAPTAAPGQGAGGAAASTTAKPTTSLFNK